MKLIYLVLMMIVGWKIGLGATEMVKEAQDKRNAAIARAVEAME